MFYIVPKYLPGERVLVRRLGLGRIRLVGRDSLAVTLDTGLDTIARLDTIERVPSL